MGLPVDTSHRLWKAEGPRPSRTPVSSEVIHFSTDTPVHSCAAVDQRVYTNNPQMYPQQVSLADRQGWRDRSMFSCWSWFPLCKRSLARHSLLPCVCAGRQRIARRIRGNAKHPTWTRRCSQPGPGISWRVTKLDRLGRCRRRCPAGASRTSRAVRPGQHRLKAGHNRGRKQRVASGW
jgi:hypothetical protein